MESAWNSALIHMRLPECDVATQKTDRYFLTVKFDDAQALEFFQTQKLYRTKDGWRYFGEIDLTEVGIDWHQAKCAATGVNRWTRDDFFCALCWHYADAGCFDM